MSDRTFIPPQPVNFVRIIAELTTIAHRVELGEPTIAKALGVARTTLRNWVGGAAPRHSHGVAMLALLEHWRLNPPRRHG